MCYSFLSFSFFSFLFRLFVLFFFSFFPEKWRKERKRKEKKNERITQNWFFDKIKAGRVILNTSKRLQKIQQNLVSILGFRKEVICQHCTFHQNCAFEVFSEIDIRFQYFSNFSKKIKWKQSNEIVWLKWEIKSLIYIHFLSHVFHYSFFFSSKKDTSIFLFGFFSFRFFVLNIEHTRRILL